MPCRYGFTWDKDIRGPENGPSWSRERVICDIGNIAEYELKKKKILNYTAVQNNFTSQEQWARLNKGLLTSKKSWATQYNIASSNSEFNYTNSNVNNLSFKNNDPSTNILICNN